MADDSLGTASLVDKAASEEDDERSSQAADDRASESDDPDLSFSQESAVAVIEMLELAVHTILYVRQIYPFALFEQREIYGLPIFQCVDTTIRRYIRTAIDSLGEEILAGNALMLIVIIHHADVQLEKFIFHFVDLPRNSNARSLPSGVQSLPMLRRQIRSLILKLFAADAFLLPLPVSGDLSFSFLMQVKDEQIILPPESMTSGESSVKIRGGVTETGAITDLKIVEEPTLVQIICTDDFRVSLHVQESEAKSKLSRHASNNDEKDDNLTSESF